MRTRRVHTFLLATSLLCTFVFPSALHAQVLISEIMYDLEGSDSKREWIEVVNTGSSAVDLSSWRFYEGESNHKLSLSSGNAVLPPGGYAIIADDATTFLSTYSGFQETVFDSSFSLSNTGETLIIRDSDLNDIDSVTYSADWGAKGDGQTLTRTAGGSWTPALPSPGTGSFVAEGQMQETEGGASASSQSEESSVEEGSDESFSPKPREFIVVDIGKNRTMAVGAAEFFEASGYKKDGSVHPYITYRWNFGNGVVKKGKKVLHQYNYPGKYVVWVSGIAADKLSATDRMTVVVEPVDLFVSAVSGQYIELTNNSDRELNLSLWSLRGKNGHYMLPQNTIILPRSSVTFSSVVTGLDTRDPQNVALVYPNGVVASTYGRTYERTHARTYVPQMAAGSRGIAAPSSVAVVEERELPDGEEERVALSASAGNALGERESSEYLWLLALLGVLSVAIVGVLVSSRRSLPTDTSTPTSSTDVPNANDFTIIEEVEDSQKS